MSVFSASSMSGSAGAFAAPAIAQNAGSAAADAVSKNARLFMCFPFQFFSLGGMFHVEHSGLSINGLHFSCKREGVNVFKPELL